MFAKGDLSCCFLLGSCEVLEEKLDSFGNGNVFFSKARANHQVGSTVFLPPHFKLKSDRIHIVLVVPGLVLMLSRLSFAEPLLL